MIISRGKRGFLLIIVLFSFYIFNANAILPDITDFNAEVYGEFKDNVRLEWRYTAYGVSCTPDWQCSDWSACINNQQTRTCNDQNNCNLIGGKPNEIQSCIFYSFRLIPDKTEGESPLTVNFNVQSNFDFATCQIDFGDGQSSQSSQCNFQHIYENAGAYGVGVTAQSSYGAFTDFADIIVRESSSYGGYGFGGYGFEGFVIRDRLNKITGKSIFDVFKNTFNNMLDIFKNLLGLKQVGFRISYNFEIYRNNLLIDSGNSEKYCTLSSTQSNDYVCSYQDRSLQPEKYFYVIRISKADEHKDYSSGLVEIKTRGTLCIPNTQISGTCFVCDNDGTAYGADNSKCLANQECNSAGQCLPKINLVKIYPKTNLIKINTEKIFNAKGSANYEWSLSGNACSVSSYGGSSVLKAKDLGTCNLTVTDKTSAYGSYDTSYIKTINKSYKYQETKFVSFNNPKVVFNNKTELEFHLNKNVSGYVDIKFYNENPVEIPTNLRSLNEYLLIEPDPDISDSLNYVVIKIYYNKTFLASDKIDEDKLKIYYYKQPEDYWSVLPSLVVKQSAYGSYALTNSGHLSLFTLFSESIPSVPPGDEGSGGGSGGGGGRGKKCIENWRCGPWSSCINGKQTRTCEDMNYCNRKTPSIAKPSVLSSCVIPKEPTKPKPPVEEGLGGELEYPEIEEVPKGSNWLVYIAILVLLTILLLVFKFRYKILKSRKTAHRLNPVINAVKQIKQKGYSDNQIKQELYKKGWKKEDIEEIFRRL